MKLKLLVWVSLLPVVACQQPLVNTYDKYQKISVMGEGVVYDVRITAERPKPEGSRKYHSYYRNTLHQSVGSYLGKLLDGPYTVSDMQGHLLVQGAFESGLQTGRWVYLDDGKIVKELIYKDGLLDGPARYYDQNGRQEVVYYQNGTKVQQKSPAPDSVKVKNNHRPIPSDTTQAR